MFSKTSNETCNVRPVLGTMTFAGQTNKEDALNQINMFYEYCSQFDTVELDTAYLYENTKTEALLGEILTAEHRSKLSIATKANPHNKLSLRAEDVIMQLNTSLQNLKMDRVNIFYLHSPDRNTPIEETLKACQTLYEQNKFVELGLSNYPAWEVSEIYHLCKNRGWILPTVYQGMYNTVTRDIERELIPCIRHFNIRLYVYNPLAGGLLTGKYHDVLEKPKEGRFRLKPFYQGRFWKTCFFDSVDKMRQLCGNTSTIADLNLSWLRNHSKLQEGDAIILGQSKVSQLESNLNSFNSSPLETSTLKELDRCNKMCLGECPSYFR